MCNRTRSTKISRRDSFLKAVKSGIMKLIPDGSGKQTTAQIDAQLNQLIIKSIIFEKIVDVYESLELKNPNI